MIHETASPFTMKIPTISQVIFLKLTAVWMLAGTSLFAADLHRWGQPATAPPYTLPDAAKGDVIKVAESDARTLTLKLNGTVLRWENLEYLQAQAHSPSCPCTMTFQLFPDSYHESPGK